MIIPGKANTLDKDDGCGCVVIVTVVHVLPLVATYTQHTGGRNFVRVYVVLHFLPQCPKPLLAKTTNHHCQNSALAPLCVCVCPLAPIPTIHSPPSHHNHPRVAVVFLAAAAVAASALHKQLSHVDTSRALTSSIYPSVCVHQSLIIASSP